MVFTWRFAVLTALLIIPVAWIARWEVVVAALALLVWVALVDFLLSPGVRKLQLQRTPGPRIRLGMGTHATLSLHNASNRKLRLYVRDAWSPSAGAQNNRFHVTLQPRESFERLQELLPTRRGMLSADLVTVRSFSSLRLVGRQKSIEVPAAVRVTPPFHARKHLPSKIARLRELTGRTALLTVGSGTEFDSLREYVRGDDVRSMDWRATARAQKPIVKTWRPERERRVVIVIDSSRLAARKAENGTVFDAQVEAGLLLAALASSAGDRVDVLIADARVRTSYGPITERAHIGVLTDMLTTIDPELIDADWSTITSAVMKLAPNRSLVVFLTSLDVSTIAQDVLPSIPLLTHKHTVAFASVVDPDLATLQDLVFTPSQVFAAAAATEELQSLDDTSRSLTQMGMHTTQAIPEDLPPKLADLYINLKAAGKL